MIGQWESWNDWSDCFLNPFDKFMTVSTRNRTCLCDNCTIYCNGPTVERKKCADIGHCRGLGEIATQTIRSCVSNWDKIANDCQCPPLYTFIIPDNWSILQNNIKSGTAVRFSSSCNPNFADPNVGDCTKYVPYCGYPTRFLVAYASENAEGVHETGLNCPQCGCGSDGAANLNDRYAAEIDTNS